MELTRQLNEEDFFMTVRVGIIGCGGIANGKHLPSLAKIQEVEMVAFCDIVVERAEKAREDYGGSESKVYNDYREMLADTELDVVHVLTPNNCHAEMTIAALESGKHVMCEKPMAKTSEEAQAMLDAAKRTGKKLTIGYQNRFRKDAKYLKTVCDDGELGEIYLGKAKAIRRRAVPTWGVFLDEEAQGGGPLIDIGTHALDLTLWTMNNYEPLYAVGNVYHKLSQTENAANAWGPWNPDEFTVEDSAFGFITMKNGATIILESSWAINLVNDGEAKTTLAGTKGGADMDEGLRLNGEKHGLLYDNHIQLETGGVDFYDGAGDDPAYEEARAWIDAVLEKREVLVKPEEAFVVTQLLEAIYESSKTGQPVYFN